MRCWQAIPCGQQAKAWPISSTVQCRSRRRSAGDEGREVQAGARTPPLRPGALPSRTSMARGCPSPGVTRASLCADWDVRSDGRSFSITFMCSRGGRLTCPAGWTEILEFWNPGNLHRNSGFQVLRISLSWDGSASWKPGTDTGPSLACHIDPNPLVLDARLQPDNSQPLRGLTVCYCPHRGGWPLITK